MIESKSHENTIVWPFLFNRGYKEYGKSLSQVKAYSEVTVAEHVLYFVEY